MQSNSSNKHVIGNVVVAGDSIYAGIDDDKRHLSEHKNAMVIKFKSEADFRQAINNRCIGFTLFSDEDNS